MPRTAETHAEATFEIRKAIVPAAGRGTRLLPATRSQPKEMLPVGRKPTIQHVVEELASAGLREILIISGQAKPDKISSAALPGSSFPFLEKLSTASGLCGGESPPDTSASNA